MLDILPSCICGHSVDLFENKADTLCWLFYWDGLGYILHSVFVHGLNQKFCVSHFTASILGTVGIWPVIKADTMC